MAGDEVADDEVADDDEFHMPAEGLEAAGEAIGVVAVFGVPTPPTLPPRGVPYPAAFVGGPSPGGRGPGPDPGGPELPWRA